MTPSPKTIDHIREYIRTSFDSNEEAVALGDDEDLLDVLDSLQVLRMVMDLEVKYSMKFDNSEMTPENLGTIAKLAAFVDGKRS